MAGQYCPVNRIGQKRQAIARSVYAVVEGAKFVRLVMRAIGAESPAQLAEKMRWKRGTERLVAKWLSGQNDPSYTYTIEMLERVGWIAAGLSRDEPPPRPAPIGDVPHERDDAILAAIGRIEQRLLGPMDAAEDLVRRLDAGERVPAEQLERVAAQVEETGRLCGRLAARLRGAAEAAGSRS